MKLRPYALMLGLRYAGARRRTQLVSFISGLSILGLMVGVGLLLTVLSVMNGFDRELRERILGILPHGAIFHRNGVEDWSALREQVLTNPDMVAAAPFVQLQAMLSAGKRVKPALLFGVDGVTETGVSSLQEYLPAALYQRFTADSYEPILVLGAGLAEGLGIEVGQSLTVLVPRSRDSQQLPRFQSLQLVGIIKTGTELDYSLALTPLMTASALSETPGRVSGIRVKTVSLFDAPDMIYAEIKQLPYGHYGTDWKRSHGNLYHAVQMSKNLVGLLLFLIVAIAAFNVVSTLVMVVVDKQGDIAILKTLGATRGEIMSVFMVQGTLIGAIGTALGVVFGVVGSASAQTLVSWLEAWFHIQFLSAEIYPVSYLPSQMQWQDFAMVSAVSLAMSLLATIYPAWRASQVQPADALRFE